jgi:hypothetical protein
MKSAVQRRRIAKRERAQEITKKISELKIADPKTGWRLLQECLGIRKGSKRRLGMGPVLDGDKTEVRGEQAREAIRDAFEQLGRHNAADEKFDVAFEQRIAAWKAERWRRLRRDRISSDDDDPYGDDPELDGCILVEEVQAAIGKLKQGKACGVDSIIAEWFKYGGEDMTEAIWMIVAAAWMEEKTPQDWQDGLICPIYKSGDRKDPLNYRGITLLSVAAKIYCSVLNARLATWCEANGKLNEEQGGFRKGRGCIDQIFVLEETLKRRK